MIHPELVEKARRWLIKQRCSVVATEISGNIEIPDAIGWYSGISTLIECKSNREDFKSDQRKFFRQAPDFGMGDYRYYLAPKGMLALHELPENWGLLEISGKRIVIKRKSNHFDKMVKGEFLLMLSLVRRLGKNAPECMSIKFYTYKTKQTGSIGIMIDGKDNENISN